MERENRALLHGGKSVSARPVWCLKAAQLPGLLTRSSLPLYGTALRQDTEDVRAVPLDRCAIVIGSEGQGISDAKSAGLLPERQIKIPMSQFESYGTRPLPPRCCCGRATGKHREEAQAMAALKYWVWLTTLPGLTDHSKLLLLQHFSSPEDIYYADEEALWRVEG